MDAAECQPLTMVTLRVYNVILQMNIQVPKISIADVPPEFLDFS